MLYDRDYHTLTEEETTELGKAEDYKISNSEKFGKMNTETLYKYHDLKPQAAYHYDSLFPNNHLYIDSLSDKVKLRKIQEEFRTGI